MHNKDNDNLEKKFGMSDELKKLLELSKTENQKLVKEQNLDFSVSNNINESEKPNMTGDSNGGSKPANDSESSFTSASGNQDGKKGFDVSDINKEQLEPISRPEPTFSPKNRYRESMEMTKEQKEALDSFFGKVPETNMDKEDAKEVIEDVFSDSVSSREINDLVEENVFDVETNKTDLEDSEKEELEEIKEELRDDLKDVFDNDEPKNTNVDDRILYTDMYKDLVDFESEKTDDDKFNTKKNISELATLRQKVLEEKMLEEKEEEELPELGLADSELFKKQQREKLGITKEPKNIAETSVFEEHTRTLKNIYSDEDLDEEYDDYDEDYDEYDDYEDERKGPFPIFILLELIIVLIIGAFIFIKMYNPELLDNINLNAITSKIFGEDTKDDASNAGVVSDKAIYNLKISKMEMNKKVLPNSTDNIKDNLVLLSDKDSKDNIIIAGHNKKALFINNKELKKGDEIKIAQAKNPDINNIRYKVNSVETIKPDQIDKLVKGDKDQLVLVTCTSSEDKRLIVKADKSS